MKKLRGLDDRAQGLEEELQLEQRESIPKFRRLYKMAIGNAVAKNADESVEIYQLVLKLRLDQNDIDLEDAEFNLLKSKIESNEARIAGNIHGQMVARIRQDDKLAEEQKQKEKDEKKLKEKEEKK